MKREDPMDVMLELVPEFRAAKEKILQETGQVMNFAMIGWGIEHRLLAAGARPSFEVMEFGPVWHYGVVLGIAVCTHVSESQRHRGEGMINPMGSPADTLPKHNGSRYPTVFRGDKRHDWEVERHLGGEWEYIGVCLGNIPFDDALIALDAYRIPGVRVRLTAV